MEDKELFNLLYKQIEDRSEILKAILNISLLMNLLLLIITGCLILLHIQLG